MESIMAPITQISGKTYDMMDWHKRSYTNRHEAQSSHNGQQAVQQRLLQASGARATSSSKPSHQGFLNWVAYTRNLTVGIHEIDRKTCPLMSCQQQFDHSDGMLLHLKTCPYLSEGLYRCIDTMKEARIGKCPSPSCRQLQQHYKDRIVTAMSSLKRRLSPRGSRPQRFVETRNEKQTVPPEERYELWDDYSESFAERSQDTGSLLSELGPNLISKSAAELDNQQIHEAQSISFADTQGMPTELDSEIYNTNMTEFSALPPYVELMSDAMYSSSSVAKRCSPAGVALAELDGRDMVYTPSYIFTEAYSSNELNTNGSMSYSLPDSHQDAFAPATPIERPQISTNYLLTSKPINLFRESTSDVYVPDQLHTHTSLQQITFKGGATPELVRYFENMDPSGSVAWNAVHPEEYITNSLGYGSSCDSLGSHTTIAPSTKSLETSVSSLGSLGSLGSISFSQTSMVTSNDSPVSFFDDPSLMCAEPDTMNAPAMSPELCEDQELSVFNQMQQSIGIVGKTSLIVRHESPDSSHGQIQCSKQRQIRRKPVPEQSIPEAEPISANFARAPSLQPEINYSIKDQSHSEHACSFCKRPFNDKSNCHRHEKTCKKNNAKSDKLYQCTYPRCMKRFSRSDNLLFHQKKKRHEIKRRLHLQADRLSQYMSQMLHDGNERRIAGRKLFTA